MKDFIYENNKGEKINLCQWPYKLNVEPMLDYEWDYTKREKRRGDIIAGFSKRVSTTNLVLHIANPSDAVMRDAVDRFNSVIEDDIYEGTAGKIWFGDWYTYGYIVASKNEKWQYGKPVVKKEITLAKEQDSWFRTTVKKSYESDPYTPTPEDWVKTFEKSEASESIGYDYQYDYMTDFDTTVTLNNPDSLPSNFILYLQGPADQPQIKIGDNVIEFNMEVDEGAVLEVNTVTKKTIMHMPDGTLVNVFGARNPDYYIFERIPAGRNAVSWNGAFNWEITLIEERSEPRWLTV